MNTHIQNLCQVFELLHLHGLNIGLPSFPTWVPGTQPLQLRLFSIRQAHLRLVKGKKYFFKNSFEKFQNDFQILKRLV